MNNRLQQALDHIEQHLAEPLNLAGIAAAAHLSSYHFARLFRAAFGRAPMEYVRLRRLTEAVLQMRRNPAVSITELAHACGFETHQGFTTAFKREFNIAPALYRERRFPLPIQEKICMSEHHSKIPEGPDYRTVEPFHVTGMAMEFTQEDKTGIPQLWSRFAPQIGEIPGQQGFTTYGLCLPRGDGNFGYVAGVAVAPDSAAPAGMESHKIPGGRYAVFNHNGSLDFLQDTLSYIFGVWGPQHNELLRGAPDFELYDHRFNPVTDTGVMEYWVPVKEASESNGSKG